MAAQTVTNATNDHRRCTPITLGAREPDINTQKCHEAYGPVTERGALERSRRLEAGAPAPSWYGYVAD
jgi:hypothetical protein